MCSRRVSPATERLLQDVRALGCPEVSARQLERWRQAGLLPAPDRTWLGRGRGSVSSYPEGASDLVAATAEAVERYRDLDGAALALFLDRHPVREATVRSALHALFEGWASAPEAGGDPFDQAEAMALAIVSELPDDPRGRAMLRRLEGGPESATVVAGSALTTVLHSVLAGDPLGPQNVWEVVEALGLDRIVLTDLAGAGPLTTTDALLTSVSAVLRHLEIRPAFDAIDSAPLPELRDAFGEVDTMLCMVDDLTAVLVTAGLPVRVAKPTGTRIDRRNPGQLGPIGVFWWLMRRDLLDDGVPFDLAIELHEQVHLLAELSRCVPSDLAVYLRPGGDAKLERLKEEERSVVAARLLEAVPHELIQEVAEMWPTEPRLASVRPAKPPAP